MINLYLDSSRKRELKSVKLEVKGLITMDTTEIKGIIRDYTTSNYMPIQWDNLEEVDKLLERYNLLRMNQKETENRNRPNSCTYGHTIYNKRGRNIQRGKDSLFNK